MIPYQTIIERLTNTTRNLETWRRTHTTHQQAFNAAWGDMRTITKHAERAYTRLHDSLPGIPSGGDSRGGPLGDPTGAMATQQTHPAVTALDRLDTDTETLQNMTREILTASTGVKHDWLEVINLTKGLAALTQHWGRESQMRWCENCNKNGYRTLVTPGTYAKHCVECGRWNKVNGAYPDRQLLFYIHGDGGPIPDKLKQQRKITIPRASKLRKRRRKKR